MVPKPGEWLQLQSPLDGHTGMELFRTRPGANMEPIAAGLHSGRDQRKSPFVPIAAKRLRFKLSIVASVLLASCGVGYYYLAYLAQRDAQFQPQRVLESFRAAAEKRAERAEQELSLFEQNVSEQRAAEQKVAEDGKPWRRPTAIKCV
jgi:hypothetical protein